MRSVRLIVCASFLLGSASALIIEHVGLFSPLRTMAFLAVTVAIGWFGRLGFDRAEPDVTVEIVCDPLCPPDMAYLLGEVFSEPADFPWAGTTGTTHGLPPEPAS